MLLVLEDVRYREEKVGVVLIKTECGKVEMKVREKAPELKRGCAYDSGFIYLRLHMVSI